MFQLNPIGGSILKFKILAAAFLLFFGCNEQDPDTTGKNEKLMFSSTAYHNHLKFAFVQADTPVFRSSMQYLDTMYYYYLANNFTPLFIRSFEEEVTILPLLEILNAAGDHGLNPEWYHAARIKDEYVNAVTGDSVYSERYEHLANAEVLLADGLIKYSWHMRYGVVNPNEIYPDSYFLPLPDSASRDLFEPFKQSDIISYLHKIQPQSKRYKDMQAALKYYQKFTNIRFTPIPVPSEKIEPGDESPLIIPIRQQLKTLEFIDTSSHYLDSGIVYDSLLVNYIKEFQRRNGLLDDGILGKGTIDKLNVLPEDNIKKIKMNLERFRWNNYSDSTDYILINIPDFRLYVMQKEEEKFNIKVCTGRKRSGNFYSQMELYKKTNGRSYKPEDWETPNMSGQISYLILNPTWTVPTSIIKEEIASEVRKDSTYLIRKNFKVYKDGVIIDPAAVRSNEFLVYTTRYRVVQDAGPGNALGKIKFMFNNPFGIYLHDTPSRAPFNKSNRAVSHGCVRVEKPMMLAEYLLKNHSKWTTDYIKLEIGQQVEDKSVRQEYYSKRSSLRKNSSYGQTTEVKLDKTVPVIIDYFTSWVDKEGKLNFRDDVYGRDAILAAKLFPEEDILDHSLAAGLTK